MNKKNIDRLFQEKFKDFEVAPNDAVWDRINESLPNKKKKRRVIALWWQIGGVAVVLALLLTVGISVFSSDNIKNQNLPFVNTDKNDSENKEIEKALESPKNYKHDDLKDNNANKREVVDSDSQQNPSNLEGQTSTTSQNKTNSNALTRPRKVKQSTVVNNSDETENVSPSEKINKLNTIVKNNNRTRVVTNTKNSSKQPKETKIASEATLKSVIETTIEDNKTATVDNSTSNTTNTESFKDKNTEGISTNEHNLESVIIEDASKASIEDAIAEQTEAIDEKEKEDEQNRWSIAPNVAPVYYSSLGQGSSLGQQFNENTKGGDINMSYGIKGAYAVSKKLKVRAGINRVNLNQSTSNVIAFAGPDLSSRSSQNAQPAGNISYNDRQNVLLMSSDMLDIAAAPEAFNTIVAGSLDQRFGFIEVPLELAYQLVDRKFGINVIGGFSTFFLNENEIYADIDGTSTLIGEANNINGTSFSANFGLGLDYSLSKQWNINLEPQFKYQLNTFNNTTGDFRPFFIGVYTGLSFKF